MMNGEGFTFSGLDAWRTDPAKCRDGVEFAIGPGQALIVRRANVNDRAIQALFAEVDRQDVRAMREIYARHLIAGWRGIVDGAGDPVPYSVDACLALLDYANELWDQIMAFSMTRANYQYAKAQEDIDQAKTFRDGAPVQAPTAPN
jgi:hypothetical protein